MIVAAAPAPLERSAPGNPVCTLTWFATRGGYHVFSNRDERRERGREEAPRLRIARGRRFIAPLDSDAGGTWIAASERGLTCCLLNGSPLVTAGEPASPGAAGAWRTRGTVPLAAVAEPHAAAAIDRVATLDLAALRPFVLALFEPGGSPRVARWDGLRLAIDAEAPAPPLVSSSFATPEVRASREATWRRLAAPAGDDRVALHLAYHGSHEPERGPLSTCMHRPEAVTRSLSWIEVTPGQVVFRYAPGPPCETPPPYLETTLKRGQVSHFNMRGSGC